MYVNSYATCIAFHSTATNKFLSYVAYIWYLEGCKFSTSTHVNYHIVQNIISAFCGYIYGFWEPKIASEIAYIDQNPLKITKPWPVPPLLSGTRDIWDKKSSWGPNPPGKAFFWGFENAYVWKCKNITRCHRNMVDSAFESWRSILFDTEKILVIRTHPGELHIL